jgi:hypothetical protein
LLMKRLHTGAQFSDFRAQPFESIVATGHVSILGAFSTQHNNASAR